MKTRRLEIFAFTAMLLAAAALFVSLQGSVRAAPGNQDTGPAAIPTAPAIPSALLADPAVVSVPATVPGTFNYQGILRDGQGNLVTGPKDITVTIYDVVTGGASLHTEAFSNVSVRDGLFNIVLGDQAGNPLNGVLSVSPRYIGITLAGAQELIPRQRIHPVPMALLAETATTATTLVPGASVLGLNLTGNTKLGDVEVSKLSAGGLTAFVGGTGFIFGTPGGSQWRFQVNSTDTIMYQNATVVGNATVGGGITANGKSVVVGDETNLRIVRGAGTANQAAAPIGQVMSPIYGAGFTYKVVGSGAVDVTYGTPFSGIPSVTAAPIVGGAVIIPVFEGLGGGGNPGPNGFRVILYDLSGNTRQWPFSFIAIGPR